MNYPSDLDEVKLATVELVCRWYRFLPSPRNGVEVMLMDAIVKRFKELGGMTPEISKKLGWGQP